MRSIWRLMVLSVALLACSPAASPRPDATFDTAEIVSARVWRAGRVETGGLWARHRSLLFTSFDGGRAWRRWPGTIPVRDGVLGPGVVVWDSERAWVAESEASVARTIDGGETWHSADLPGSCLEWTGMAFASVDHGYLVCLVGDHPSNFVVETHDGGVTWSTANASVRTASGWFGTQLRASGTGDLWAAAIDQDSGTQPILAGSRDGGRTWFEVWLPGAGATFHGGGPLLPIGPPVVDGSRLAFAAYDRTGDRTRIRIWDSGDAGATWAEVKSDDRLAGGRLALVTPDHWIVEDREAAELHVTVDAGGHWAAFETEGLTRGARYGFIFSTATDGAIVAESPAEDPMHPLVLFVTQDGGRTWRLAKLDP